MEPITPAQQRELQERFRHVHGLRVTVGHSPSTPTSHPRLSSSSKTLE